MATATYNHFGLFEEDQVKGYKCVKTEKNKNDDKTSDTMHSYVYGGFDVSIGISNHNGYIPRF